MWLFPEEVSSATEAWVFSTNAASTTAEAFKKYFGILKEIKPEAKALKIAESKQDWKAAKESATKCAEILHQAATELKNTKVGTIGAAIVNLTLATIPAVIQTAVTNTLLEKQSERFSKKMEKRYYDEENGFRKHLVLLPKIISRISLLQSVKGMKQSLNSLRDITGCIRAMTQTKLLNAGRFSKKFSAKEINSKPSLNFITR